MAYWSTEAWPQERTKRSRSTQWGEAASYFMTRVHSTWARGARAMAVPWWPLLAARGMSIDNPRITLMARCSSSTSVTPRTLPTTRAAPRRCGPAIPVPPGPRSRPTVARGRGASRARPQVPWWAVAGVDDSGPDAPQDGGDAFEGVVFDATFVADASIREPTAEERLARLRRIEDGHQRIRDEWAVSRAVAARDDRRKRWLRFGAGAAVLAVVVAVAIGRIEVGDVVPAAVPTEAEEPLVASVGPATDRPTPAGGSTSPLGAPPPVADDDRFAFISTQPGSVGPGGPGSLPGADAWWSTTGPGPRAPTTRWWPRPSTRSWRPPGCRSRSRGRPTRRPAPSATPCRGTATGTGGRRCSWPGATQARWMRSTGRWRASAGGQAFAPEGEEAVYVTGQVVLDGPQIDDLLDRPGGLAQARAIVMHELAHLVGLDHVNDPSQLDEPPGRRGGDHLRRRRPGRPGRPRPGRLLPRRLSPPHHPVSVTTGIVPEPAIGGSLIGPTGLLDPVLPRPLSSPSVQSVPSWRHTARP